LRILKEKWISILDTECMNSVKHEIYIYIKTLSLFSDVYMI
jgi:hypothetical protein